MALAMRVARAFDRQQDEAEALLRRIITPVAKYWICKRCPPLTAEAMEVLGGNGYVEESMMPRLYRQAPLNSIWEGSGNIMCLDVLRAMRKHPRSVDALFTELAEGAARSAGLLRHIDRIRAELADADVVESLRPPRGRADRACAASHDPRAARARRSRRRILREPHRA